MEDYILIGILIIFELVMAYFFTFRHDPNRQARGLVFKVLASASFVAVGRVAYQSAGGTDFAAVLVLGLAFGFGGDVVLQLRRLVFEKAATVIGGLFFLLGHVAYVCAMFYGGGKWYAALVFAVIVFPFVWKILKSRDADYGKLYVPGLIYMFAETFMAGAGFAMMISVTTVASVVFFAGSLCFLISDIMWIFENFCTVELPVYRKACLVLYYIAQTMIALSIML